MLAGAPRTAHLRFLRDHDDYHEDLSYSTVGPPPGFPIPDGETHGMFKATMTTGGLVYRTARTARRDFQGFAGIRRAPVSTKNCAQHARVTF